MQPQDTETLRKDLVTIRDTGLVGIIEKHIPKEPINNYKNKSGRKLRNRVYTLGFTLTGMLYQSSQDDKSYRFKK